MQHIPTKLDHENEFIAGALALDFANTVGGSRARPTHDHISRYADLVAFARQAKIIDAETASGLLALAKDDVAGAVKVLDRSIRLREAVWHGFTRRGGPKPSELEVIASEGKIAAGHRNLAVGRNAFTYLWDDFAVSLDRVLWPIAQSAIDILTSHDREVVRQCESETCAWVFLDRTRNHSRRWCVMGDCGNRAKARRFRERKATRTAV
jgi:predicted RNA-binding Zn ribbon-like protein